MAGDERDIGVGGGDVNEGSTGMGGAVKRESISCISLTWASILSSLLTSVGYERASESEGFDMEEMTGAKERWREDRMRKERRRKRNE